MFYGEYRHSLDEKGRLILPSRFRDVCTDQNVEQFFLTRGLDKCIFMFSAEEWRIQEQKFKNKPFMQKEARMFNRLFFSGAVDVFPDKQGRFIIPQYLKDYAAVDKDTVLIGVSNRIEIWDRKIWDDLYASTQSSYEQIAEKMIDL